jgi:beta-glucosidase-like glycosyl hydrolase/CubicO group peptidase (beta-lactamase class C family)
VVSPRLVFAQETTDTLQNHWVDSVMASLTLDEKIAQMMMIRTYSNKTQEYYRQIETTIKKYNIGGLCFFQGGPVRQAKLTNRYQEISKTPLFIALDAEWGLGMRLDSCFSFPYQMTLGSINDDLPVYEMGAEIARQLNLLGVHINFAPVVDINNNPKNPVINSRSFGEEKQNVARKGVAYMKGLQDNGIIATAKHFPGHGDTDADSHLTLPVIKHDRSRIDSIELYPFQELINNGLMGVMIAHLFVPSLDSTLNTPTTLSPKVVTKLLKEEMGFEGLVITDALDMKGVTTHYRQGEIELRALLAGNDILLLPQDVGEAIQTIKSAVEEGVVSEELINDRCRKILFYKQKAGLDHISPLDTDSLYLKLNNINNELISRKLYKSSVVVLKNENEILPLQRLDTLKIATLSIGSPEINPFQEMLGNYCHIEHFNLLHDFSDLKAVSVLDQLKKFNLVIVGFHHTSIFPHKNFGISEKGSELVKKLADSTQVVLTVFASPYSLKNFDPDSNKFTSIVMAHQDNRISNEIAAQIIMGGLGSNGKLPVSIAVTKKVNDGIRVHSINRLCYSVPEEVGMNSTVLKKIDSIVLENIHQGAIPGCQVLVAKDGKVVYRKSYGYHTYKKGNFVKNTDLYDLASLTKIAATTLSVMKLCDDGLMDVDHKMVWYLPFLRGTNKEDMVIREMMAHTSSLQPWIPFYLNTLDKKGKLDSRFYSAKLDDRYTVKVAENLYIINGYNHILYDSILYSKLRKKKEYKYSDLGFYLLRQAIENLTNQPFDNYVNKEFYKKLGLQTMTFNPLNRFSPNEIVPTENDRYFRNQLVHGYVHDPGAAMLGGVSGHAGLFSNANDLAIIMQMLLQKGYYGGVQYIQSETVKEFTKQQFPLDKNRRGIGFDKPDFDDRENGPTCKSASTESFGHTGFTGTYAWADPKYNLIYIFLSNRIHPTANNTKLIKMDTRTKIQQVVYDAMTEPEKKKAPGDELGAVDNNEDDAD